MSARTRRPLPRWLTAAFAALLLAASASSFAVGRATSPALTAEDLVPTAVNTCVTAVKASLVLLDPDSIVAFSPADIEELRTLPGRCLDEKVYSALHEDYPHLLHRLAVIGTPAG